ncbi:capsular biosynthesis protein [Altererythrobacter sp. Root672]|uniref:capsular biosynthesis protein n=1 Tax=Altererythrobacter sp. Root672 TaxID=1736584 RepID=UPI0006FDE0AB|nr:capsular biosynthesis protein [Altererythrobacter sp. Root672]KRA83501.1 capsular biosynthesis protein [Altererythrobacter sp. Root672]
MTEHSKIPLPGQGDKGGSLFERAEGLFGAPGELRAAPVPTVLAPPANRPRRPVAPLVQPDVQAAPKVAETVVEAPVAAAPVPRVMAQRVEFTAERQSVDRARLLEQGFIVPDGPVTTPLEEFRIVKRQLLLAMREGRSGSNLSPELQRVLVCSPLPGEGKTFCATNLALAVAAERDAEVVLVDADFAKPSILTLFGLEGRKGLMDALADPAVRVEDCVVATDIPGLFVLPAGDRTSSDSEYLSSGRTREVLDRLTAGAPNRVVIFDSPPALAASPAAELAKYVAQALVICRADQTGQRALEDALSLLSICPDIKLLLNSANFSPSGRRFGAYYGYGGDGE